MLDHLRHGLQLHHAMGNVDVRVHRLQHFLGPADVPQLDAPSEVHHDELVAHVSQDGLLQLAVVAQPARAAELDEDVGAQIERLGEIAQDVLEGRAHVIARVLDAHLASGAGGLGQGQVVHVEHLLAEELERRVVVAVAEERRLGVLVVLRLVLGGFGGLAVGQKRRGVAPLQFHGYRGAHLLDEGLGLTHGHSLPSAGSAGYRRSFPRGSPRRRCRTARQSSGSEWACPGCSA